MRRGNPAPLSYLARGAGPGLLLVHGGGATAESTYGPLLPALAARRAVVAPNYTGVRPDPGAALDVLADQHVATATAAGLERFAVVGHSLGSMIGVQAALRHPDRVTALVLTAGFAHAATSFRLKARVWRSLLAGDPDLLARYLMSVMFSHRYLGSMTDAQVDGFAELVVSSGGGDASAQIELALSLDLRGELAGVRAPALVVATADDQLVPPYLSAELAAAIPGATLASLDCGHHPALECAPDWARLIDDFLTVLDAEAECAWAAK
ncbi:alpha/beta hydrolase [Saccharothrix xinjiangensis]|uniref:Alpha/beta fold hydrolase n=1 Tax=Saccharothrix xinjiangensis TaxID=204798 RepID=A0ABV9Y2N6_9PSEU